MSKRLRLARRGGVAVTAVIALSTLTACGSDSNDKAESTGAGADGDSVKVMVYGPFDATGYSIPGTRVGAKAGVDKVNEEGGINGTKLELIECNEKNDPNAAAGCARQAVNEGVVAVVGGLSNQEKLISAPLAKAGIPIIGNLPVADFAAENQYPFAGGGAGVFLALGKYFATLPDCGGKVSGVLDDIPQAAAVADLVKLAVTVSGGTWTEPGKAPQGSSDFGPAVAAGADGAPCLALLATPTSTPQMVVAGVPNPKVKVMGTSDSSMPGAAVRELGSQADGVVVLSEFLPLNDSTKAEPVVEFLKRARAIDKDFDPDASAASAYLAPQVLKAAMEGAKAKKITSETITAALDQLAGFDTGLGPKLDFTQKNPAPAFARLPYKTGLYTWTAKDGVYVLDESADPVDLSDIYDAVASAK